MRQLYKGMQDPDKKILLIGADEDVAEIRKELSGQGLTPQTKCVSPELLSESLQDLEDVAAVCCVSGSVKGTDLLALYQCCQDRKMAMFFCTPGLSVLQRNMQIKNVGFLSFLSPVEEPLSHWWNRLLKRLFDLLVSGVFLFLVFPLIYIVAAIVVKRKSPGSVFSVVKEIGWTGKPFGKFVFRTDDLPADSFFQKPAVKSLPQFLNVFAGSMSVVPGIVSCQFCKNADMWYRQNWSLWLDVKILLKALLNKNKMER